MGGISNGDTALSFVDGFARYAINMDAFDLTIFTIATNKYLDYFDLQKEQISKYIGAYQRTQILVATNVRAPGIEAYKNLTIQYVAMDDLKWPEVTLLRYHQLLKNAEAILGTYVMWLDTDMSIQRSVTLQDLIHSEEVHFARQPGFVFSKSALAKLSPMRKLGAVIPWIKAYLKFQHGAGTWEARKASTAFVAPGKRSIYVHGAVWLGNRGAVIRMAKELAQRIDDDLSKGIIAVWHDESHLNWYFANSAIKSILPKYFSAWDKGWQFDPSQSFMLSLDKTELDSQLTNGAR